MSWRRGLTAETRKSGKKARRQAEAEEAGRVRERQTGRAPRSRGAPRPRGVSLSGGARQRLAISRAILRAPRLLLLDEATSALDALTELHVRDAIERAKEGRTTLVVAHRLATVIHADRVLVMDQGRIVEMGTPRELLARRGLFHALYEAQRLDIYV